MGLPLPIPRAELERTGGVDLSVQAMHSKKKKKYWSGVLLFPCYDLRVQLGYQGLREQMALVGRLSKDIQHHGPDR